MDSNVTVFYISVQKYLSNNVALQLFPLHDIAELKNLGNHWYRAFFKEQPIRKQPYPKVGNKCMAIGKCTEMQIMRK